MSVERTFIMIKPDGVQRGLIGEVVARFERKGFKLTGAKLMPVSQTVAESHYAEHRERPFFGELVSFITSSPVFAMVWEGENVISTARGMMGKTNPSDAESGTIRGDLAVSIGMNIVHGSDSPESAKREIALWFPDGVCAYERAVDVWLK